MKASILALIFFTIITSVKSQTIHIIDFDSTHVVGNTDTTINVAIGDSVVVLQHQDDDDFEVIINGADTIGAYNILYDHPIYSVKISDNSINTVKIIYFDPNQYRQIFFNYLAGINLHRDNIANVHFFPNPATDRINFDIDGNVIAEIINMRGEILDYVSLSEKKIILT